MKYIHEYYVAMEGKEILIFIWMDLEDIAPCEINQTKTDKYYMIFLTCEIKKKKKHLKKNTTKNQNGIIVT